MALSPTFVLEAPDDRQVRRLATLCGMRIEQFRRRFEIRSLFEEAPRRWDEHRARQAGKRLGLPSGGKVVGVARAADAIGCAEGWNQASGARLFRLASPALLTFWDDAEMRAQAGASLKAFLELA